MSRARDISDGKFANDLTVDTNTLFVDASADKVAFGTTDVAAAQVTIKGSGNPRQLVITDDGAEKFTFFQIGDLATIEAGSGGSATTALAIKTSSSGTESEVARFLGGGGLTFNGDTAAANALDSYEEGSYTPQISATDGIGTLAYLHQVGRYVKVGQTVTFVCRIALSSKGSVAGTIRFTLPFTAHNVSNGHQTAATRFNNTQNSAFSDQEQGGRIHPNENIFRADVKNSSGSRANMTAGNLGNSTDIMITGSYIVA